MHWNSEIPTYNYILIVFETFAYCIKWEINFFRFLNWNILMNCRPSWTSLSFCHSWKSYGLTKLLPPPHLLGDGGWWFWVWKVKGRRGYWNFQDSEGDFILRGLNFPGSLNSHKDFKDLIKYEYIVNFLNFSPAPGCYLILSQQCVQ